MTEGMIHDGKFEPGRYPLSPIEIHRTADVLHPIQRIGGVLYRTTDVFKAKDILFEPERWYPISAHIPMSVSFDQPTHVVDAGYWSWARSVSNRYSTTTIGRVKVFHRTLDELTVEGELYQLVPTYPKLFASVSATATPGIGKLLAVAVCRENMDHTIPPYQLFPVEAK